MIYTNFYTSPKEGLRLQLPYDTTVKSEELPGFDRRCETLYIEYPFYDGDVYIGIYAKVSGAFLIKLFIPCIGVDNDYLVDEMQINRVLETFYCFTFADYDKDKLNIREQLLDYLQTLYKVK